MSKNTVNENWPEVVNNYYQIGINIKGNLEVLQVSNGEIKKVYEGPLYANDIVIHMNGTVIMNDDFLKPKDPVVSNTVREMFKI